MPSRKRTKTKRKSKSEDRSRIIECVEDQEEPRLPDHSIEQHSVKNQVSSEPKSKSKTGGEKCSKEVHFAFLPDKYEQLIEENDSKVKSKEEELEKRRLKYKKIRKNVGKAMRFSWKCLVAGLQTFASVYSTPLSAATTIIPEVNRARPRA